MPTLGLNATISSTTSVKRQRSTNSTNHHSSPSRNTTMNRLSTSDLSASVRVPTYLDKSKHDISALFQDLEWQQRGRLLDGYQHATSSPYRLDRSGAVADRNRYSNVQPWMNSRVKLRTPVDGSDYVNASPIVLKSQKHVKGKSQGSDGITSSGLNSTDAASHETRYIASQGPKQEHCAIFWRMVHQESIDDTGVVIMLTPCYEGAREKCAPYFPPDMRNPKIDLTLQISHALSPRPGSAREGTEVLPIPSESNANLDVPNSPREDSAVLLEIQDDESVGCTVRKICVTVEGSSKIVRHYLFQGWPDFAKPEGARRRALLQMIRRTRMEAGPSPRIVHCSAGVGRTGTFIALDFLLHELDEGRLLQPLKLSPLNEIAGQERQTDESRGEGKEVSSPTNGARKSLQSPTWGNSGPAKVLTPTQEAGSTIGDDPRDNDLIHEVVNSLREQRMMMVMNEVQFAFIYEVVRECFFDKYQAKPEGAVVKPADVEAGSHVGPEDEEDDGRRRGKAAKIAQETPVDGGTNEATVNEGDDISEAETEIMSPEERSQQVRFNSTTESGIDCGSSNHPADASDMKENVAPSENSDDPYRVVAPEHIRKGL